MEKTLVIVESPTKAKTIKKFLGNGYVVESSFGHVRDLPKTRLGVDVDHDFVPKYVVPAKAKKQVEILRKLAKKTEHILFATDEDREGEAISWHLAELLEIPPEDAERIVFHEITKRAIEHAVQEPRSINMHLVDAQQARRVLDRLVGYELSPFLWKKVARGLSAGRVQSVAVRLIVERERERLAFKAVDFWSVEGQFHKEHDATVFPAKLISIHGEKLSKLSINTQDLATSFVEEARKATFQITDLVKKDALRKPPSPYTTSTLQQDANHKLGFSSKQTMRLAQQLYEGINIGPEGHVGLITYMRTDSVNLSTEFITSAREVIQQKFGKEFIPETHRTYHTKSKLAQEAHEAIRPTEAARDPQSVGPYLDSRQLHLYTLIWNRAMASQMHDAQIAQTSADLSTTDGSIVFRATGSTIRFPGFLKLYPDSIKESLLPELQKGNSVIAENISSEQHTTEPPARYSEATLVKELEEKGIGRPSTYAPTMSTIEQRGYVTKEDRRFAPTEMGMLVNDVLVQHFPEIVDYEFTASMEDQLDDIAKGEKEWAPVIKDFYQPFKQHLMQKEQEVSKKELTEETTDQKCEKCGKPMVIKMGRFGKFLACTGYPECRNTKQLDANGEAMPAETTDEKCELCGKPMAVKHGRYGTFLGCSGYPDCKGIKKIEKTTGVKCNKCGKGEMVEKRSRRGKLFYSCNQYPTCENALWSKPTGERCASCASLMVFGKNDTHVCSNNECTFGKKE